VKAALCSRLSNRTWWADLWPRRAPTGDGPGRVRQGGAPWRVDCDERRVQRPDRLAVEQRSIRLHVDRRELREKTVALNRQQAARPREAAACAQGVEDRRSAEWGLDSGDPRVASTRLMITLQEHALFCDQTGRIATGWLGPPCESSGGLRAAPWAASGGPCSLPRGEQRGGSAPLRERRLPGESGPSGPRLPSRSSRGRKMPLPPWRRADPPSP